jgi:hypothetical protein
MATPKRTAELRIVRIVFFIVELTSLICVIIEQVEDASPRSTLGTLSRARDGLQRVFFSKLKLSGEMRRQ